MRTIWLHVYLVELKLCVFLTVFILPLKKNTSPLIFPTASKPPWQRSWSEGSQLKETSLVKSQVMFYRVLYSCLMRGKQIFQLCKGPIAVREKINQKAFICIHWSSMTRRHSLVCECMDWIFLICKMQMISACCLDGYCSVPSLWLYSLLCWPWRRRTRQAWEVRIYTTWWPLNLHTYNRMVRADDVCWGAEGWWTSSPRFSQTWGRLTRRVTNATFRIWKEMVQTTYAWVYLPTD